MVGCKISFKNENEFSQQGVVVAEYLTSNDRYNNPVSVTKYLVQVFSKDNLSNKIYQIDPEQVTCVSTNDIKEILRNGKSYI